MTSIVRNKAFLRCRLPFPNGAAIIDERLLYRRRMFMNKNELITAMSEASGLPKKDCEIALNAFTGVVENALKAEDKVQLVGFGSFEVKARAARTGRNPRTKEPVEIAASKAPVFKAGKALKDAIQ